MGTHFYAQLPEIQHYAEQVDRAGLDLYKIGGYVDTTCTDTAGFDGILNTLEGPVRSLGEDHSFQLNGWYSRLDSTSTNLKITVMRYEAADKRGQNRFDNIKGEAPLPSNDGQDPPASTSAQAPEDYLKPPERPKNSAILRVKDFGSILPTIDWVIKKLTGWSLLEAIFQPITGDWDKIQMHADAWGNVAKALDAVAENLHRGLAELDPHWQGGAAGAFHHYMDLWQQGLREESDVANSVKQELEAVAQTSEQIFNELSGLLGQIVDKAATLAIPVVGWAKAAWQADDLIRMVQQADDLIKRIQDAANLASELLGAILSKGDIDFVPEARIPDQGYEAPQGVPQ